MGGGSQRSAAPWEALPPKGGAFFCGLRPDDEKNYQQFGQRRLPTPRGRASDHCRAKTLVVSVREQRLEQSFFT